MQIVSSDIVPIYKETITEKSSQLVMVKSPNRHNRLFGMAKPINSQIMSALINFNCNQIDIEFQMK